MHIESLQKKMADLNSSIRNLSYEKDCQIEQLKKEKSHMSQRLTDYNFEQKTPGVFKQNMFGQSSLNVRKL